MFQASDGNFRPTKRLDLSDPVVSFRGEIIGHPAEATFVRRLPITHGHPTILLKRFYDGDRTLPWMWGIQYDLEVTEENDNRTVPWLRLFPEVKLVFAGV